MASPAASNLVLEALHAATSQDINLLKPAESRLQEWESEPGFYTVLMNIVANHGLQLNIRWLAILCMKNGVDRYWRRNCPKAISEEEKDSLRNVMLGNLTEPEQQIAVQQAVLIAKIARLDFPRAWPELVTTLVTAIKDGNHHIQHRSLLTLHHVVKTLASKRLAADRRLFHEMTMSVFPFLVQVWATHSSEFLRHIQVGYNSEGGLPAAHSCLERALLALRILRRLVVHGYKRPHESSDAAAFLNMVLDQIRINLDARFQSPFLQPLNDLHSKLVVVLIKILLDILEHHPFSFVPYISSSLELVIQYAFPTTEMRIGNNEGYVREPLFERLVVHMLNLIKGMLVCAEYKPSKIVLENKEPIAQEAHAAIRSFFTQPTLENVCRQIVMRYLVLSQEELKQWDNDPETFAAGESSEFWKCSIRPCAECLFKSLVHTFHEHVTPVLLSMMANNNQPAISTAGNLDAILKRDALYCAFGLASFELYEDVNFNEWFQTSLLHELRMEGEHLRVLRRRATWLIGQWIGVRLSVELRPVLYESLLGLLRPTEDLAVRLAAAQTLQTAVDDFEFCIQDFLPYLEGSFGLLFTLLQQAVECETKMKVLYVMSFVIERIGPGIQPFVGALVQYLPLLWNESASHNLLRCSILTALYHLVQSLGSQSVNLLEFLVPVIQCSTDITQDSHVYLLEDGLELWLALVQHTNSPAPAPLLHLCGMLPQLLEISSENMRTCLLITQAYIVLAPEEFMMKWGNGVAKVLTDRMPDLHNDGLVLIMRSVDIALRASPALAPSVMAPIIRRTCCNLLDKEHTSGSVSLAAHEFVVIARTLLVGSNVCAQCISEAAETKDVTAELALSTILKIWNEKMQLVTQLESRKLMSLALLSIMDANCSAALEHFCAIILNVTEVLNDLVPTDDPSLDSDGLLLTDEPTPSPCKDSDSSVDSEVESSHDRRKRQMAYSDPVHTVALKGYLQKQIDLLKGQLGPVRWQELVDTLDVETAQEARLYVTL